MPKTFGNPGNFALTKSRNKFNRFLLFALLLMAVIGYAVGLQQGLYFGHKAQSSIVTLVIFGAFFVGWLIRKQLSRFADKLTDDAIAFRKGAEGEGLTADALSTLPDTFSVFHDLTHPSFGGNIDHLVVGPTGIFVLETKNWKGMVTLSGQGTLKIDGQFDHTHDGKFVLSRAFNVKKKIEALSNIDTFVQAVMVFPKASVSVEPDTHCALYVQRLDKLEDFLKRPSPRPLSSAQVDTITRDLQALFKI